MSRGLWALENEGAEVLPSLDRSDNIWSRYNWHVDVPCYELESKTHQCRQELGVRKQARLSSSQPWNYLIAICGMLKSSRITSWTEHSLVSRVRDREERGKEEKFEKREIIKGSNADRRSGWAVNSDLVVASVQKNGREWFSMRRKKYIFSENTTCTQIGGWSWQCRAHLSQKEKKAHTESGTGEYGGKGICLFLFWGSFQAKDILFISLVLPSAYH